MLKLFNQTDEKIEWRNGAKCWELLRRHKPFFKAAAKYYGDPNIGLFEEEPNFIAACCMKWMVKPRFQKMRRSRKWLVWDGPDLTRTEARSFKALRLNQPWPETPEKFRKEPAGITRHPLPPPPRPPVRFNRPPFGPLAESAEERRPGHRISLTRVNSENILIGIPRGSYTNTEVDQLMKRVKALYRHEQPILRKRPESFLGSAKQWTAFLLFRQEGSIKGACSQWDEIYCKAKYDREMALERHKFLITRSMEVIRAWPIGFYPKPHSS